MATSKSKKASAKKSTSKPKAPEKSAKAEKVNKPAKAEPKKVEKVEKVEKTEKVESPKEIVSEPKKCESAACGCGCVSKAWKFFDRKCPADETILTVFKNKKIWGALLGEAIGTMLITLIMMCFGVNSILYIMLAMIAVVMAVYTLSGAHLNPLVTVGMMVTRRVSAIRGVLYIIAQVVGAWLALLLLNAYRSMGGEIIELPAITAVTGETFGPVIAIELLGACLIGFFFARALQYKRSALTFAFVMVGGLVLALLCGIQISGSYLGISNNFVMNPAMALMMQIFPTAGESVGEVLGGVGLAVLTYVVLPMVGGVVGFLLSDISSWFSQEKVTE